MSLKKLMVLVVLSGVLSVFLGLIGYLSAERAGRRDLVTSEISQSSARAQEIIGPALAVDVEGPSDAAGHKQTEVVVLYPRELDVDATIAVERRHRGIFEVPVYSTDQRISGAFDAAPLPPGVTPKRALLIVGLSDVRGLSRAPTLTYAGSPVSFEPGTEGATAAGEGLRAPVPLGAVLAGAHFEMNLEINGTHDIRWAPIAGNATVHVTSSWPHPSFVGTTLPAERTISARGFTATWRTNPFQSGVSLTSTKPSLSGALAAPVRNLGVGFPAPGDSYAQVDRAVKYGFLFVFLTFSAFAIYESTRRLAIHPVQYTMVGVALVVFFLVLLSLAEHLSFAISYVTATLGSLSLLVSYLRHVLGRWKRGAAFGAMFATLYGALFVLLRLEEYALVAGSVIVFALLATAMFATRRVDWYKVGSPHEPPAHPYREYGSPSATSSLDALSVR